MDESGDCVVACEVSTDDECVGLSAVLCCAVLCCVVLCCVVLCCVVLCWCCVELWYGLLWGVSVCVSFVLLSACRTSVFTPLSQDAAGMSLVIVWWLVK